MSKGSKICTACDELIEFGEPNIICQNHRNLIHFKCAQVCNVCLKHACTRCLIWSEALQLFVCNFSCYERKVSELIGQVNTQREMLQIVHAEIGDMQRDTMITGGALLSLAADLAATLKGSIHGQNNPEETRNPFQDHKVDHGPVHCNCQGEGRNIEPK